MAPEGDDQKEEEKNNSVAHTVGLFGVKLQVICSNIHRMGFPLDCHVIRGFNNVHGWPPHHAQKNINRREFLLELVSPPQEDLRILIWTQCCE